MTSRTLLGQRQVGGVTVTDDNGLNKRLHEPILDVDTWNAFARLNTGNGEVYAPRGTWTYGFRQIHRFGNEAFGDYVQRICAEIEGNGDARVPGDGRLKNRAAAEADGVSVTAELMAQLRELQ